MTRLKANPCIKKGGRGASFFDELPRHHRLNLIGF